MRKRIAVPDTVRDRVADAVTDTVRDCVPDTDPDWHAVPTDVSVWLTVDDAGTVQLTVAFDSWLGAVRGWV